MDIITDIEIKFKGTTAVALGRFDGVHLGHKALIDKVISKGEELEVTPTVFTFNSMSSNTLKKSRFVGSLINDNQKRDILDEMGIELLYMVDFNQEIKQMSPESFVKNILIENLNAKIVVVGFNYRFGYMGEGTPEMLKDFGKKYGFDVIIIEPVSIENKVVSSTLIRELLASGDIDEASRMMGRLYTLEGKVVSGKGRGRTLGFPTANLQLDDYYVLPKPGVYKTNTSFNNVIYQSITSVGWNPTFSNNQITVETFLFNFKQDLYNSYIKVSFEKFLRGEKKFNTKEELISQIEKDIMQIKSL